MNALFEIDTFPFHTRLGAELVRAMESIFPSTQEARLFAGRFKIRTSDLRKQNDIRLLWRELLRRLAAVGKLRDLVQTTLSTTPRSSYTVFLADLVADQPVVLNAEPVSMSPAGPNENVTVEEAYLFYDDLTIGVKEIDGLVRTLNLLSTLAPSVCHIAIDTIAGTLRGTGFKIGAQTILTNHHVLFPGGIVANNVTVRFGFDQEAGEPSESIEKFTGKVETIMGEKDSDWAVIDMAESLEKWPIIDLTGSAEPKVNDKAFIIQHPGGHYKRLGFVRNKISEVDGIYVRYLTDTEGGSSGAPVFDSSGRIMALHHSGGRPVEVAGKPPVVKNEGIKISHVLQRYGALRGLAVDAVVKESFLQ